MDYARNLVETSSDTRTQIEETALWIEDHTRDPFSCWPTVPYHGSRGSKRAPVALSSTEAEYTALSDAAREAIHLSGFLTDIGLSSLSKVTLHNDN